MRSQILSKQLHTLLLIFFSTLILFPHLTTAQDDLAASHKGTLTTIYDEAFNGGNLSLMDELYAVDYTNHGSGEDLSVTDFKAVISAWRTALPNFEVSTEILIAEDEWAASRVRFSGTFTNEWSLGDETIPPNNKPLKVAFNILHRFNEQGQIAEDFTAFDRLGMLLQMDAAPPLPDLLAYTLKTADPTVAEMGESLTEGMEEQHKEAYSHVIEDALNLGDLSAIDTYMTADYQTHEPFGDFSRDAFRQVVQIFRTVVPDLHVETDVIVAEGDWLAGRLIYTGTFSQNIGNSEMTFEATNKPILFVINVFVHFNEEGVGFMDFKEYNRLGWLQQLGLLPIAP